MGYQKQEIKKGVNIHIIDTNRFKTNLLAVFLTFPVTRENVTKNALIDLILRRGTKIMPTQEAINRNLEELYGASFDLGIDKTGDNHVMKFYIESIHEEYTIQKEKIAEQSYSMLFDIIFNPITEQRNGRIGFKQEYLDMEKEKLKQIIESKIDDKASFAVYRCVEEMYQGKPYGLYQYGYVEDLEKIEAVELYEYYQELIQKCKIDIFVSGSEKKEKVVQIVENNEQIQKLSPRNPEYIVNSEDKDWAEEVKTVEESMDVAQGKLVIGLTLENQKEDDKYIALVYNTILGGTANSKLFQNVREKASLAYTAGSSYVKPKNNIFIRCGIDIQNYSQAVEIIKEQIKDMAEGKFEEEDIQNAKNYILSTINGIEDEQDTEITYYLGQELSNSQVTVEEYKTKIQQITKEDIMQIAKGVKIVIIYFLKN